jgi:hypothetical protein
MFEKNQYVIVFIKWILFLLEIISWLIVWAILFFSQDFQKNSKYHYLLFLLIFPFILHAILTYCNMRIFPFQYSYFGTKKRSIPPQKEYRNIIISWAHFGKIRAQLVSWYFYDTGVDIKIWGIGKVFLPYNSIISIVSIDKGILGNYYKITHTSKEIRNPICCPHEVIEHCIKK